MPDSEELRAARRLAADLTDAVERAPALGGLDPATRDRLRRGLSSIQQALATVPGGESQAPDPYAFPMAAPNLYRGRARGRVVPEGDEPEQGAPRPDSNGSTGQPRRPPATETLAARAGALADEIDFPAFVSSLVHGTFDAVVDASIRQMESYADLVSAVAKSVDDFTNQNVTLNQARDHLAEKHPADLWLDVSGGQPVLRARAEYGEDGEGAGSTSWLADYGLGQQELTDELVETQLVPAARRSVGESRQQLLATMVLLGMSRINVRDGRISARVRFRAAATDKVALDFAASQDPGTGNTWGSRGSSTYANTTTMVSTVGVNAQSDTDLKVELFGQVELNFVSETLPLERFADTARMALLHRSARWQAPDTAAPAQVSPDAPLPPGAAATTPAAAPPAGAAPPQMATPSTPPPAVPGPPSRGATP